MSNAAKTRTIGYVRVSTNEQADGGVSLAAQRERIAAYAKLYGLKIVEVIEDAGISGKTLDRPGLQRALAMLKAGEADALLVTKLDRLTRSVRDLGELIAEHFPADTGKPALLSVAEQIDTRSAGGRLVLNVLGSVAQWEREIIAERTTDALSHKKSAGEVYGGIPFGFDRDGDRLVVNKAETKVIREIQMLRGAGTSLHGIADKLNAERVPTKRGGKWYAGTVKAIMENDLHAPVVV